ncbi:hypothetical protein KIN20_004117 [Parelaphostrongylus tenuis]|uniref:Uncharacterized protein n=1 Tax=Parelaphostrongylus tenuis TaxID=148309 RepID=A0AAD5QGN8_PARTN|nr:hypothetical protein KIN20_004117 [Parelaphostrongylus tenuis]
MIRNGGFRMPATGRYSSIGGIRSSKPRPSLLPLGINVFDSKVSASDKEKVRDFLSARCNAAVTPSKMAASPLTSDNTAGPYSLRSSRSVRFRMEAAIEEQRESDGDAVLQPESTVKSEGVDFQRGNTNTFKSPFAPSSILKSRNLKAVVDQEPSTSSMLASYGIRTPADTSRKEVTPGREHYPFLAKARRALLQSPLPSDISTDADFGGNKNGCVNSRCVPNFDQCCYTHLFNMSEEDWSKVEPIMVNQLADLLQERRERINEQANIRDTDMSESLASLPDDILPCEPKKTGFRRIDRRQKQNSSVDLQANQEIVLINESARNGGSARRLSRLRLKDPVSRIIGGDSPFAPIRDSPL